MKGRKPNASGGLAYMLGEPTYAEGGRIPYQTGGTKTTEIRRDDWTPTVMPPLHQAPTVMPPLQQVRQSPVETTQDVVVDTAAGPFAGAKTAALTEAQGRKMPFENYYVGANPTAEQAAFMQKQGAVPLHQRAQAPGILSQVGQALNPSKETILQRLQQNQANQISLKDRLDQHNANNQLLRNALTAGKIDENQYKRMGGYDVAQQIPGSGLTDAALVGGASTLYNTYKAGLNTADPSDPYAQYGKYGPEQSIDLNIRGATGLNPTDLQLYNSIINDTYGTGPAIMERQNMSDVNKEPPKEIGERIYDLLNSEAATPTPDVTKPTDVAGPSIPEYYRRNPSGYDFDLWQQAYAKGTGMKDATTIGPEGQIQTSFGSWDPSRTYSAYRGDTRTSGSGPFYDPNNPDDMTMASVMKSMYGAPGAGKAYFNSGGLAYMLGE